MKIAKVKRPEFDENLISHPFVRLTATVTSGLVSKEFDLGLRVKMKGITDSQAVILDLSDLSLPSQTKTSLTLPTLGKNGSKISWTTSDGSVINTLGVVSRPSVGANNANITLTALCERGNEIQEREFTVTVLSWTTTEELEQAVALTNWDLIKKNNTNSQAITGALSLPAKVGRDVETVWSTTSNMLDINTGTITRPSYTQGQLSLSITATLSHGGSTRIINLPVFVIAPLPMTNSEVLSVANGSLEASLFLGTNEALNKITSGMKLPYRLSNTDASRAVISWSLVTHTTYTTLASHPNIALSSGAEFSLAAVTRPTLVDGNAKVALKATITVGDGADQVSTTKHFDITILLDDTI